MKNYYHMLTYEQRAIQEMVRQFADEKIIPICKECDITGRFPAELYKEAFELGLTTFTIPEKYGGAGGDIFTYSLIKEELARGDAGFSGTVAGAYMGVVPIKVAGNDYHWKLVADILTQGGAMSFTLTEPNAGSDSAAIRTQYVVDGDSVIINGTKGFISNGEIADLYLLFATKDPSLRAKGISCFIVPRDTPGISIGKHEDKMGLPQLLHQRYHLRGRQDTPQEHDRRGRPGHGHRQALPRLHSSHLRAQAQSATPSTPMSAPSSTPRPARPSASPSARTRACPLCLRTCTSSSRPQGRWSGTRASAQTPASPTPVSALRRQGLRLRRGHAGLHRRRSDTRRLRLLPRLPRREAFQRRQDLSDI